MYRVLEIEVIGDPGAIPVAFPPVRKCHCVMRSLPVRGWAASLGAFDRRQE